MLAAFEKASEQLIYVSLTNTNIVSLYIKA